MTNMALLQTKTAKSSKTLFPRGKKAPEKADNVSKPKPKVEHKGKERDLFGPSQANTRVTEDKKNQKRKKVRSKEGGHDNIVALKHSQAQQLTYSQLTEGQVILGVVSAIREYDIRVSIPGRLVGTVPITAVSKPYTAALERLAQGKQEDDGNRSSKIATMAEMFHVGQVVCACVKEVARSEENGFFQVKLSLSPPAVNSHLPAAALRKGMILQAAVVSSEDHGFIMDIGIQGGTNGVKAFLPLKKATKYVDTVLSGAQPSLGQLLPCYITKCDAAHAVTLSLEPLKLQKSSVDSEQVSVHTMLPGMSFSARVEKEIKAGWLLKIGNIPALLHYYHSKQEALPVPGASINVKVLYVLPTVNTVYVTCQAHLEFGLEPSHIESLVPAGLALGAMVKEAEVVHATHQGLLMKLASREQRDDILGVVPTHSISDSNLDLQSMKSKFSPGTKHACRVMQYDYADRMFVCSTQKSILNQKVVQASSLQPGDKVSGTIKRYTPKGVVVELGRRQEAFIPFLHLSDVALKNPEKKYPVGTKLNCRVLRSDLSKKKLHLTHKSILVKEQYPVVSEFDPAAVGVITEGTVVSVCPEGLLLQLFGDVRGWVRKSDMSMEPIEYPEKLFYVGQVLKCQVLHVDAEQGRMNLSLIIGGTHRPLGSREKKASDKIAMGKFYACVVQSVDKSGLSVDVAVQSTEDEGATPSVLKAFIPKNHLTDFPGLADQLLASYRVGERISKALCFEKDVLPILSVKPCLLRACEAESLPQSFEDLQEGVRVPGVVCLVKKYGVFLRLPTWKFARSALVPMRYLADFFVNDPNDIVSLHQTIYGCVIERREAEQKVTMSAKLSDLGVNEANYCDEAMQRLKDYYTDLAKLRSRAAKKLRKHREGAVVLCKVLQVLELGISVDVEGVQGIITNSSGLPDGELVAGAMIPGVVLSVDYEHDCLQLSADPLLVSRMSQSSKKKVKLDYHVRAEAVHEMEEFGFVTMCIKAPASVEGRLVHVPCTKHYNDFSGFLDKFTTGDVYNLVIKDALDDSLGGDLIGILRTAKSTRKRVDSACHEKNSSKRQRSESECSNVSGRGTCNRKPQESELSEHEMSIVETQHEEEEERENGDTTDNAGMSLEGTDLNDPGWSSKFNPWESLKRPRPVDSDGDDSDESESHTADQPSQKKLKTHISKKEKKALDKLEAEEIARAEKRVLDGVQDSCEPECAEDFDRLLLSSPNSSLMWVKYMAFHMEQREPDKAREVAKRALEKINFREDDEKLNIYMALFNLEIASGNEPAAEQVFSNAIKYNDEYKVYMQAAHTYASSGKLEQAEKLYKTLAKKYCKEMETWLKLGTFYFQNKNLKEARFTLQRSIQNLDKKHHVDITGRFGQLEFKLGEPDRGKTIFETILKNYPKRTDIWCVYADQLVKLKEMSSVRTLFDRVLGLGLQPKKMKALFKKWVELEEAHGDAQTVGAVRKKAIAYVEAMANA